MSKTTLPPPLVGTLVPSETFGDVADPTPEQCTMFLELVAMGSSMHAAAKLAGVPYISFGREALRNEAFARDMQAARLLRNFALEEIAIEQCTVGVEKVLTHQGRVSYHYEKDEHGGIVRSKRPITVKKLVTSNRILLALLKAKFPEKYGERGDPSVNTQAAQPAACAVEEDGDRLLRRIEQELRGDAQAVDRDQDPKG